MVNEEEYVASKKYLPQHPVTARRRAMEWKHRLPIRRRRKSKRGRLFWRRRIVGVGVVAVFVVSVIVRRRRHLFRRLRFAWEGGGGSLFCKRHAL